MRRIGGFLIGLGVFMLVLFVISDSVLQPEFGLLGGGVVCLGLGIFLMVTNPNPQPQANPRFRLLKHRGEKPPPQPQSKKEPLVKPAGPPAGANKPGGGDNKAGAGKSGGGKPGGGKPSGPPGGKR